MAIIDTLQQAIRGTGPETNDTKYEQARTHLLTYDMGRSSYFDVEIGSAISLSNLDQPQQTSQEERAFQSKFVCHAAELPGESLSTVQQKVYGVVEQFPTMTVYQPINLSFYTYGSGIEKTRNYFLNWITTLSGRTNQRQSPGPISPETTYNVQYKDRYARDIIITQYTITGQPLLKAKLIDAFPISLNQSRLDWSDQNSGISLSVTFAYTEYVYSFYTVDNNGKYSRGELDPFITAGIQGAAAINTIYGAIKSGNPAAIGSILPGIGLSNFTLSSIFGRIGL